MGSGGVVCRVGLHAFGSLQVFPDVDLSAVVVVAARLGVEAVDVEGLHCISQLRVLMFCCM